MRPARLPFLLLALLFAALALLATADANNECAYRYCSCANKNCSSYTNCQTVTVAEGACGPGNRVCDCDAGTVSVYATSACTGAPTNVYHSGSCYNKSRCWWIDSCVAPSPAA